MAAPTPSQYTDNHMDNHHLGRRRCLVKDEGQPVRGGLNEARDRTCATAGTPPVRHYRGPGLPGALSALFQVRTWAILKKKLGATPPRGCSSRSPTRGACPASRRTPARAAITSSAALAARPPPAWWCVSSWLSLAWPLASSLVTGGGWWLVAAAANSKPNARNAPRTSRIRSSSALETSSFPAARLRFRWPFSISPGSFTLGPVDLTCAHTARTLRLNSAVLLSRLGSIAMIVFAQFWMGQRIRDRAGGGVGEWAAVAGG